MKKLYVVLLLAGLYGCENKVVSQQYYKAHLNEAKEEVTKCANSKDANSASCDNAQKAIWDYNAKQLRKRDTDGL